ncbi:MAG: HAD family hydrolase [Phycisphaerae bacterium]
MPGRSAVIFDFDGTLTEHYLDFDAMRAEIGVEGPILEAIEAMDEQDRKVAEAILLRHERAAAENATLREGAREAVAMCHSRGHPVGILTRNARVTLDIALLRHGITVDAIRTRTNGAIKPSPEPVWSICREMGADPVRSWMVGDHLFDILAGDAAGTRTILLIDGDSVPPYARRAQHVISRLGELNGLIDANAHVA